jgi:hypothetical protein
MLLTLVMAIAMFVETVYNSERPTKLNPDSRSHILRKPKDRNSEVLTNSAAFKVRHAKCSFFSTSHDTGLAS